MAEPAAPESPKPGVERSTAGLVVALYLGATLLLAYITYRVIMESRDRLAPPDPDPAALAAPPPAPLVATRLPL
ncbi:hypothetical protein [Rubricoccus marinus]|uniref:Uncharacterized protein n=1 Tax=Rubricoccus marinus TaxID=716817 RepID=A0A259TV10_9BACT|nr:hypothetical protein [Rubricoccus marinus]OZC01414.1 hypothetical protein BSZ36_17165 [Rubricoccus marinus]